MNKVVLVGRLTKEPEANHKGETAFARYTLAVDRKYKKEGQPDADFIRCVSFGKTAEFAEKWFTKGMRVAVSGRIQTGSYKDKDDKTVYTTDVIVEEHEFAQSKSEASEQPKAKKDDGFKPITGLEDLDDLPFN